MKVNRFVLKRGLSLVLALVACLGLAGGAALSEAAVNGAGEYPIVPEGNDPVVLTVTTVLDERIPIDETNYSLNYIQEKANIKLDFTLLPMADARTKLNLMLASGDYTDVIQYGFDMDQIVQFGMRDGIFIPMNDLYEKYGHRYKELFELRPQYKSKAYAPDGNLYGFLLINESYHVTAYPKLWFNYEWLNDLGLEEPQTTEELYQVLKAFKEKDPNGNGKQDEIPLTGGIEPTCSLEYFLLNSFLPVDDQTFCYAKDGKVQFAAGKDAYKEGLTWLKQLFDEGLIDRANFTQKTDQLAQLVRQEPMMIGGFTSGHIAMGVDIANYDMSKMFGALPPVAGPDGTRYQPHTDFVDMVAEFGFVITDKCENPEVAFRYGDMNYEEDVTMIKLCGEPGNFWGELEPGIKSISGGDAKYWARETYGEGEAEKYLHDVFSPGPFWRLKEFNDQKMPMPDDLYATDSYEARLYTETDKVVQYFYPEYLPRTLYMIDDAEEFAELKTNIVSCAKTYTSQFIMGEKNIDGDWDAFLSDLNSYGIDRYVELYQKAYDDYLTDMAR